MVYLEPVCLQLIWMELGMIDIDGVLGDMGGMGMCMGWRLWIEVGDKANLFRCRA